MARSNSSNSNRGRSGSRNNNPEGRNQYSSNSWMDTARERPMATAAAAAAAVGAGVFLWSRRNQISEQIGSLGEQISEWRDSMMTGDEFSTDGESTGQGFMAQPSRRGRNKSQTEISEEAMTLKETGAGSRNRSTTTA